MKHSSGTCLINKFSQMIKIAYMFQTLHFHRSKAKMLKRKKIRKILLENNYESY